MKSISFKKIIPSLLGFSVTAIAVSIATPLLVNKNINNNTISLVNKDGFETPIKSNQSVVYSNNLAFIVDNQKMTATVIGFQNNFNKLPSNNNLEKSNSELIPVATSSNLVIPGIINQNDKTYIVDSIGVGAFFNQGLTTISLPSTIVTIGADAFANNKLTNLDLPSNLKTLGSNSFSNNYFKYGTRIFLPPNCQWNKNGNLAPFNNTQNLGKFAPGVQTIIQNSAVYQFSNISNVWRIESYMPSIADGVSSNVTYSPEAMKYVPVDDPLKQPGQTHFTYDPITVPTNSSLSTTRIIFKNNDKWFDGSAKFENQKMILSNVKNENINLTVYSPSNNQTIFDSKTSKENTVQLQYGDILNFGQSNIVANIATNVSESENINNSNFKEFNIFYQITNSINWQNGLVTSFIVTENGLIPYQNITHIQNNILVSNATQDYTAKGTTLANHNVQIQVGNNTTQVVKSNSEGVFEFVIPKETTLNTMVKINVEGCNESQFKLIGANPIKTAIFLQIGPNQFAISPDGYDKKFKIWNSSNKIMPSYNNPNPNVLSDNFKGDETFKNNKLKHRWITLSNTAIVNEKTVISSTVIDLTKITSYSQLQDALNSLEYYPHVKNTLKVSIPETSNYVFAAYSGDVQIPISSKLTWDDQLKDALEQYTFNIDESGMQDSNESTPEKNLGLIRNWIASNYMLVSAGYEGKQLAKNLTSNWYDLTPLMWQTVRDVTANLQTSYQKAVALSQWVSQNMVYDVNFAYYKSISQIFNHLHGVCGHYAILLAVLCQMSGIVSRVVYGYALGSPNYFSRPNAIDHAWTQIWDEQLGEWITLDPTWNWYSPYGQIQSKMNITRSNEHIAIVLWPRHTNYFSYFKGHEDQALNMLGMYYGVKQGQPETQYPAKYAINFAQLINQASSYNDNEYGRISNH